MSRSMRIKRTLRSYLKYVAVEQQFFEISRSASGRPHSFPHFVLRSAIVMGVRRGKNGIVAKQVQFVANWQRQGGDDTELQTVESRSSAEDMGE